MCLYYFSVVLTMFAVLLESVVVPLPQQRLLEGKASLYASWIDGLFLGYLWFYMLFGSHS